MITQKNAGCSVALECEYGIRCFCLLRYNSTVREPAPMNERENDRKRERESYTKTFIGYTIKTIYSKQNCNKITKTNNRELEATRENLKRKKCCMLNQSNLFTMHTHCFSI